MQRMRCFAPTSNPSLPFRRQTILAIHQQSAPSTHQAGPISLVRLEACSIAEPKRHIMQAIQSPSNDLLSHTLWKDEIAFLERKYHVLCRLHPHHDILLLFDSSINTPVCMRQDDIPCIYHALSLPEDDRQDRGDCHRCTRWYLPIWSISRDSSDHKLGRRHFTNQQNDISTYYWRLMLARLQSDGPFC